MEVWRAEIEIHVAAVFNVAVILLCADERRLWEKRPVIIAACVFFAVGLPGHISLFIAPDTLLAGPQRERLATQIEVRELLATTINMVFWFCGKAQPNAVMAGAVVFEFQLKAAFGIDADMQRGIHGIAACEADIPARILWDDGGFNQGNLFIQLVLDAEIATEHINIGFTRAHP
ncbi:hypothetical protein D3C75_730370 [compost metagenome]